MWCRSPPCGMCQDSESGVVDRPSIGYRSPCIEVRSGGNAGLPILPGGRDTGTGPCHGVVGYRLFRCRPCRRTFNERTGTPFNHLQVPTDIALLVVLWRLPDKVGLLHLTEMFTTRGSTFPHESVRAGVGLVAARNSAACRVQSG